MLLARLRASLDSYIRKNQRIAFWVVSEAINGIKSPGPYFRCWSSSCPFPFANVVCDICGS